MRAVFHCGGQNSFHRLSTNTSCEEYSELYLYKCLSALRTERIQ